jgi:uncharacterized membrane protein YsdA (DUF1294 family)
MEDVGHIIAVLIGLPIGWWLGGVILRHKGRK